MRMSDNATVQVNGYRLHARDLLRCPQCDGVVMRAEQQGVYTKSALSPEGHQYKPAETWWMHYTCAECGAPVTESPVVIVTDEHTPSEVQRMLDAIREDHYTVKLLPDGIELRPSDDMQRTYRGTTLRYVYEAFMKGRVR